MPERTRLVEAYSLAYQCDSEAVHDDNNWTARLRSFGHNYRVGRGLEWLTIVLQHDPSLVASLLVDASND